MTSGHVSLPWWVGEELQMVCCARLGDFIGVDKGNTSGKFQRTGRPIPHSLVLMAISVLTLYTPNGHTQSTNISDTIRDCQQKHFLSPSNMAICITTEWQQSLETQKLAARNIGRTEGRQEGLKEGTDQAREDGRKQGFDQGLLLGRQQGMEEGRGQAPDCGPLARQTWTTTRKLSSSGIFSGLVILLAANCDNAAKRGNPTYALWLEQTSTGEWRAFSDAYSGARSLLDTYWIKVEGTPEKIDVSTKLFVAPEPNPWTRVGTLRWDASNNCFVEDSQLLKLCRTGSSTSSGAVPK